MGTAATMQIEENMALAARRGMKRTLRPGITRADREDYRERLKLLGYEAINGLAMMAASTLVFGVLKLAG